MFFLLPGYYNISTLTAYLQTMYFSQKHLSKSISLTNYSSNTPIGLYIYSVVCSYIQIFLYILKTIHLKISSFLWSLPMLSTFETPPKWGCTILDKYGSLNKENWQSLKDNFISTYIQCMMNDTHIFTPWLFLALLWNKREWEKKIISDD